MAAPTFGASGTAFSGSGAGVDIAAPGGVVAGSIVVADWFLDGATNQNVVAPAGWFAAENSPVQAANHWKYVFWHRASGAESGPYSFTWDASVFREGQAHRYDGCVASGTPFDTGAASAVDNTSGSTSPAVSVTTAGADRCLVHSVTCWAGGTWTPNASPAFTKREQPSVGVSSLSDATQAAAGSSGSITAATTTSDKRTAWLGALKPLVVNDVTGTAAGALGGATGTAVGVPTVLGVAGRVLGGTTGTAAGTPTVLGAATGVLGGLAGAAHVASAISGTAHGTLGALSGAAVQHVVTADVGGGWYGLMAIRDEARQMAADDQARGPLACPNDGEPLRTAPDGGLYCSFDGWRPT